MARLHCYDTALVYIRDIVMYVRSTVPPYDVRTDTCVHCASLRYQWSGGACYRKRPSAAVTNRGA